ncbi:malate synthase 1 [Diutina catenulata]
MSQQLKNPFPTAQQKLKGSDLQIVGQIPQDAKHLLGAEALAFVTLLHQNFNPVRLELLQNRVNIQKEYDAGKLPDFLPETKHIREDPTWQGPALAEGLIDRRCEITGPAGDAKMVINALNSGTACYMSDFEDSMTPAWANVVSGQVNMQKALDRSLSAKSGSKTYKVTTEQRIPTLIVRPRGWHLDEKHVLVNGEPVSGGIFDFAIYFFNNWKYLKEHNMPNAYYLPKMQHHLEAKLWASIFKFSEDYVGLTRGSIRASVLIETLPAAFQMDEIIYQLRDYSAGLNCGRWDYIFSYIKSLRNHPEFVLPDRSQVTMAAPFMSAYVALLVQTTHKRGVHALGGMSAQIPRKDDEAANKAVLDGVRADKIREVTAGCDSCWVAHPGLVPIVLGVFNEYMKGPNQINTPPKTAPRNITARDLLTPHIAGGKITENGIRANIVIGLGYVEAWLRDVGCVPINYLMEDAATAEVSRSQLWQWVTHGAETDSGKKVTKQWIKQLLDEEYQKLVKNAPAGNKYKRALEIFTPEALGEHYNDFVTTLCYDDVCTIGRPITAEKL